MSEENMYDDVNLDEALGNQETSKPDDGIQQQLDDDLNNQVQQSMFVAGTKNPDQHAKVISLAESFGARSDFVEKNYEVLRAHREQVDVGEKLMNSSPKLKEFVTDPDTAAITKDDLDNLAQIEKEVEKRNFADDAWTALKAGGFKLNAMLAKTPGYLANALLVPENIYHKAMGEPQKYFNIENDLSRRYDKAAEDMLKEAPTLTKSATDELSKGNYAEAGKTAALQFIQNTPQQLAILGSMATGVGEIGLIGAGLTTAAEKAGELQAQGVEPLQAVNVAATHGVIEAAFESLGTGGVLKAWEHAAVKQFGKQAGREFTFNFAKQIAYTVGSEANEEFATSIAQDFTDYVSGVNPDAMKGAMSRALDAGIIGGLSGGLMSAPTGAAMVGNKISQLKQIENDQRFYKALGDNAEASKVRERLPSKMGEYVDHLTQDGPVQTIYMNAEGFTEFFQKKEMSAADIAKELGITDSYNKALETGADIEIPTSVMAEKLATPEYKEIYDGLAPHVKFNPADLTPFEVDKQKTEAAESIKAEYEAAKVGKTDEQVVEIETSAKEVGKDIETQLKENNGFSPKAAKAQAKLYEEFFKIQGMKSGTDPLDLFKKYGLNVRSLQNEQAIDGDITYNQPQHLMSHKLMLGVTKVGNKLAVNPANGVEASGLITDSEAGKTFVVDKFIMNKKYEGVSSDMITSLERSAAAQGAQTMMTSTSRLGITPDSPVFKMYTEAGFTPSTADGQNDVVLVKKLSKPRTYNESRYYQSKQNEIVKVKEGELSGKIKDKGSISGMLASPDGDEYWFEGGNKNIDDVKEDNFAILEHIEVDPKERRSGVGKQLIESFERQAAANGAEAIYLNASPVGSNKIPLEQVVSFYKKNGFKVFDDMGPTNVVMKKEIKKQSGKKPTKKQNLARAEKLGFDTSTIYYHGSNAETLENDTFDLSKGKKKMWGDGVYLSTDKDEAGTYGKHMYETYVKVKNTFDVFKDKTPKNVIEYVKENFKKEFKETTKAIKPDDSYNFLDSFKDLIGPEKLTELLKQDGYDSLKMSTFMVVFDPKDIKHVGANFKEADTGNIFTQDNKGSITFGENRQFNINLFNAKDESTFLHETGHFFLEVLGDLATSNEQSKQDYDTLLKWFGVNSKEEIKTEHHEQFARGFESYLRTGEAPNSALKKAFHTFRAWLMKVYQQASQLNVEVTPEVKAVFDRMFASDEQIQNLENNGDIKVMFGDPTAVGFSEKEAAKYTELAQAARTDARDKLQAELMQDVVKQQTKEYKERYASLHDEAMKQAEEMPEFKAIKNLQGEYKLSKPVIEKEYPQYKDLMPPNTARIKDGMHPDLAAGAQGYEDGEAMLKAITPYNMGIDAYVDNVVSAQMKEFYPELLESPMLSNEAIKAAHTDNYRKLKRMELEFLAKEAKGLDKKIAEKLIRRLPKDALVQAQAIKITANTAVKDLKPHLYRSAEKRYSIEAAKYYKKGEYELAFESKRKEYLNFEIYRAVTEAQEDVQKTVKKYKETFRRANEDIAKTRDVNMVAAAKSILVNYGIIKDTKQKTADYIEKIKQYDPDTYSVISQLVIESTPTGDNYQTGSYDDFVAVKDTVDAIYDLAKSSNEILADGKLVQKQAVIDALSTRAETLSNGKELPGYNKAITDGEKRGISLLGLLARYRKVEHWARAFDGGDLNGSASAYLFRPVSHAQTIYELKRVEVQKQLEAAAKLLGKQNQKDISAFEIGYTFKDKQELLHALLHTGNESNYEKLLLGRKWGDQNLDNSLNDLNFRRMVDRFIKEGVLTKKDFDFVQSIWDVNESLKPEAQKAHKKMYGYYFNEITAKPFSNSFGDYRGGYVPAIADKFMAFEQAPREAKALLEGFNNSYMFPTTGRGFTKNRVDQYHAPLELNLQKITGHVNQVLKFTHIEPAVKGTAKILSDKSLVYTMAKVDSQIIGECLIPWLQRTAVQRLVQPGQSSAADKVFSALRRNSSMQFMALNVANWFQNTTGLFQVSTMVSPGHILGATKDYLLNPKTYADTIMEKSDLMKTRVGDNVRDVSDKFDELVLQPTKFDKVSDAAAKFAFFGERISNGIIEQITWGSAYREQIQKGVSEKEAVKYADSVVRQTLIDPTAAGSSSVQAGTPFARLFTMLSGFFFNSGNLLLTEWQIAKQMGLSTRAGGSKASKAFIMVAYAPAVVSALIMKTFAGKGLDEDDDGEYFDDAVDLLFSGPLRFMFAMVPGGTILNTTLNQFNNKPFDDKISLSPAVSSLEDSIKAVGDVPKAMTGHGDPVKALKEALTAVGLVSGLPVGVLKKPITYIDKVEKGKAKPKGPVDYTRGLVTGK